MRRSSAAFGRMLFACDVDERPAHRPSGDGQEVTAILPVDLVRAGQTQERLVHERRGLQQIARLLATEEQGSLLSELGVEQARDAPVSLVVATVPGTEQAGNLAGTCVCPSGLWHSHPFSYGAIFSALRSRVTTQDLWPRIEQLYHAALALPEPERLPFVRDASGGNDVLRREVESLLAYESRSQGLMAAPAIEAIAPALDRTGPQTFTGRRFGPYEIDALIGSGGMGEVYRARDVGLRRNVAIKVLPAAFSADADRRARFEREAQLLAALNHPHIGAIYGFEQREGVHALVLELFEGQTLAETLRSGPLPVQTALTIARQIADALEAAHDKGIVHRDLKPGNIGLTHDGVVKVFDFGLAKAGVDDSTRDLSRSPTLTIGATYDGVILGTAGYMSPEQARGKPVDKRTDIWAFGCVLLEMLTGRKTFSAETVSDTIVLILDRDPNWAALPASTPPGIRRLLRRCLEKDRKRRVHHIADARIEIDDALHEPAVSVLEPPTLDGDRRAVLSRPMRWAAAAASAALLGLGIVVGATWRPAVPASSGGLARLTIALPSDQLLQTGRFTSIALSPDGKLIVYAAARGGRAHDTVPSAARRSHRPTDSWHNRGGDAVLLTRRPLACVLCGRRAQESTDDRRRAPDDL